MSRQKLKQIIIEELCCGPLKTLAARLEARIWEELQAPSVIGA